MESTVFIGVLAFATFVISVGVALYSKREIDARVNDRGADRAKS